MNIQAFTRADKENWLSLWQGYLDFYQTQLPQAVTDGTWQNIITTDSPIFGFGAWQADKLVGIVHVTLHAHTWTTQPCCYLIDLFVLPETRGQGVGGALIDYIYEFAKNKNCNRVYWMTKEDNATARALYDTLANKTDFVQYRHNL